MQYIPNVVDIQARQILLGNLIEEEQGEENHPEPWKRFAEGLGCLRNQLTSEPRLNSKTCSRLF
ncbi:MAG: hypothetical protein AB8U53_02950 [Rickettsia aeschlimannii]